MCFGIKDPSLIRQKLNFAKIQMSKDSFAEKHIYADTYRVDKPQQQCERVLIF